jgi:hypothetical protein
VNKLKFEPDDFLPYFRCYGMPGYPSASPAGAAKHAQWKFDMWLSSLPVIYKCIGDSNLWSNEKSPLDNDTHIARLTCIEELPRPECEHSPAIKQSSGLFQHMWNNECSKCGKKLKAEWREA